MSAVIHHDFDEGVTLRNRTRYTDYDKFYQNYNAGAINATGTSVQMSAYNNYQSRKNIFNQTDLSTTVEIGSVKHKLLAGIELGQQSTDYLRKTGTFPTFFNATSITIPLALSAMSLPVNYIFGASTSDRNGYSKASTTGIYLQDQIEFSKKFHLIAGVRHDQFNVDYRDNLTGAKLSSRDNLVSPRFGAVSKPTEAVSLYANYSLAYFPRSGDQLNGLTTTNQALDPEKFVNYEIGAKWDMTSALSSHIAVYRLNRSNVAIPDPVNAGAFSLVDGQRTHGVELGVTGNITKK